MFRALPFAPRPDRLFRISLILDVQVFASKQKDKSPMMLKKGIEHRAINVLKLTSNNISASNSTNSSIKLEFSGC